MAWFKSAGEGIGQAGRVAGTWGKAVGRRGRVTFRGRVFLRIGMLSIIERKIVLSDFFVD